MMHTPYGVRENWTQFAKEIQTIITQAEKVNWKDFKGDIALLDQAYTATKFLANLCQNQSIHSGARGAKPSKDLLAASNLIFTMQNCRINGNKEGFDSSLRNLKEKLDLVYKSATWKIPSNAQTQEKPFENLHEDEKILNITSRIRKEKEEITERLKSIRRNEFIAVEGSIGINHLFKADQLPASFSKISMQADTSRNPSLDPVAPLTILHNQTFIAAKPLIRKAFFRYDSLTVKEYMERLTRSATDLQYQADGKMILADPNLSNMTHLGHRWLSAKAFKGVLFWWYYPRQDMKRLGNISADSINLLWE